MIEGEIGPPPVTVGLLPWGQVIEDYLDGLHLNVDDFASVVSGGWLFGYVDALVTAGVGVAIILVSREVRRPERRAHAPTGTPLWVLPPTKGWRIAREMVADSQAWSAKDVVPAGSGIVRRTAAHLAHHSLPWLATPTGALRQVIAAEGITALLCQEYEDARLDLCLLAARRAHIPVSASFQGGNRSRTPLERLTRPLAVRAAGHLVVGSATEAARVHAAYRVAPDRILRVPNPLALDEWPVCDRSVARATLGIPNDAEVVAWHGRVDMHRKGLDVLVASWRRLVGDKPRRRLLLLVGDGYDADELRAQLGPISGYVRWLDRYVTDRTIIREHLAAADVAVLPSRHEGFAVALLEAMASGRAVVATDVPGVTDVAPRGERDGIVIVPPGDALALAAGLDRVMSNRVLAANLGRLARARVEHGFSPRAVGSALSASLRSDIARCKAARGEPQSPSS